MRCPLATHTPFAFQFWPLSSAADVVRAARRKGWVVSINCSGHCRATPCRRCLRYWQLASQARTPSKISQAMYLIRSRSDWMDALSTCNARSFHLPIMALQQRLGPGFGLDRAVALALPCLGPGSGPSGPGPGLGLAQDCSGPGFGLGQDWARPWPGPGPGPGRGLGLGVGLAWPWPGAGRWLGLVIIWTRP